MTANRAGVLSRARMGLNGHNRTTLTAVTVMTGALLTASTHAAQATTTRPAKAHPMSASMALAHATALWHQEQHRLQLELAQEKRARARAARLAAARATQITPALARSLAELRSCESTNNYRADTGNGFYGAYQFDLKTWRSVGMTGLPHEASPAEQDRAAATLHAHRGWQPWPVCGRRL
jgi:hypothetical protein